MRTAIFLTSALLAGFLGSSLQTARTASQIRSVIRASSYELRARDGSLLGVWGEDEQGSISLELRTRNGQQPARIGIDSAGSPFIVLNGLDGKLRFGVQLTGYGQPVLVLSDAETEGRILLGLLGGTPADPTDTPGASASASIVPVSRAPPCQ
jgi:hypothetical protein